MAITYGVYSISANSSGSISHSNSNNSSSSTTWTTTTTAGSNSAWYGYPNNGYSTSGNQTYIYTAPPNTYTNTNYYYQVDPQTNKISFIIGGVAFCISNFDYLLDLSMVEINRDIIDYRHLDKKNLLSISSVLMKYALLGECMQMPILLFLAVYSIVNDNTDAIGAVKEVLQKIHTASESSGPIAIDFGSREGEILRMTVEAAMNLESLAEDAA